MGSVFRRMRLLAERLHLFFKRHRCLRALVVLIVVVVMTLAGALIFAPDRIRQLAKKVGEGTNIVAQVLPATLPPATKVDKAYWLSQNWSARDRYWFHHSTQGTATFPVPYIWFLALERPEISLFGGTKYVRDEIYLSRFGFIPSPDTKTLRQGASQYGYDGAVNTSAGETERDRVSEYPENLYALPVGFAKMKGGNDPASGKLYGEQLGFTCAACHTGHIEYKNVSIRFDGGPAMVNLGELERAVGLAIGYTLWIPSRFGRFADEVARLSKDPVDKKQLKKHLEAALSQIRAEKLAGDAVLARDKVDHLDEGFGRLDALNRIGNQVFFTNFLLLDRDDQKDVMPDYLAGNFARHDAPVSFPPIWSTPWFNWAQYDNSVRNPLVRNAGEALGVNAKINLTAHANEKQPLYKSSVELLNIYWFERMLAGPAPLDGKKFGGLLAPKWTDAAGKFPGDAAWNVNPDLVNEGRGLYQKHCIECHRGPVADAKFDEEWPNDSFWRPENWSVLDGKPELKVVQMPVEVMGTDRQQSRVLIERRVNLPASLGLRPSEHLNSRGQCNLPISEAPTASHDTLSASFVLALMAVVDKSITQWFKDKPSHAHLEAEMRGPRPNCQNALVFRNVRPVGAPETTRAEMSAVNHYRARPLDGVWATAPYLHNGSVPTLQDMLIPQDKRPKEFCVGSRQFDPVKVGLATKDGEPCGAWTSFDTRQLGNSNAGHSFEGTETNPKKLPNGIVGPELKKRERDALVEYLKTL